MTTNDGGVYSFKNLLLWRQSQDLAVAVIELSRALPREDAARVISRQLVASAGSVPGNIAEGHGRFSRAAYRNHLSIARGSLCETESWLDLLQRAGYLDSGRALGLTNDCHRLIAALTRAMQRLDTRSAGARPSVREDSPHYGPDKEALDAMSDCESDDDDPML